MLCYVILFYFILFIFNVAGVNSNRLQAKMQSESEVKSQIVVEDDGTLRVGSRCEFTKDIKVTKEKKKKKKKRKRRRKRICIFLTLLIHFTGDRLRLHHANLGRRKQPTKVILRSLLLFSLLFFLLTLFTLTVSLFLFLILLLKSDLLIKYFRLHLVVHGTSKEGVTDVVKFSFASNQALTRAAFTNMVPSLPPPLPLSPSLPLSLSPSLPLSLSPSLPLSSTPPLPLSPSPPSPLPSLPLFPSPFLFSSKFLISFYHQMPDYYVTGTNLRWKGYPHTSIIFYSIFIQFLFNFYSIFILFLFYFYSVFIHFLFDNDKIWWSASNWILGESMGDQK